MNSPQRVRRQQRATWFPLLMFAALTLPPYPPVGQYLRLNTDGMPAGLASPGAAIGLGLLVLAWAERNRALLGLALVYLLAVLVPPNVSGIQPGPSWYFLPAAVQGSLLLLGGLAFALAQRSLRTPRHDQPSC